MHFTNELLEKIQAKGIEIANVTLHVGIGTFRPVKVENVEEHDMHSEHFYIKPEEMCIRDRVSIVLILCDKTNPIVPNTYIYDFSVFPSKSKYTPRKTIGININPAISPTASLVYALSIR